MWSTCVAILAAILVLNNPAYAQNGISCENPRGEQGNCKNIKSCEPLLNLLRQYGNQVGEFLRQSVCGFEGQDPLVCCPFNGNNAGTNDNNGNNGNDKENNNNNNNNNNNGNSGGQSQYFPLNPPTCGTVARNYTRVVGGRPAILGQFPWMAVLGYRGKQNPNKPRWLCGGALVTARHVLTAGHCIYRRDDLFLVRLGEHDLENTNDGASPIDVGIERRTIHPQYSPTIYTNDVAVLRLDKDIQFTDLLKPLCLPLADEFKRDFVGSFPFIAGWGSVYFNGPSSSVLQQLQVPVVSQDECKRSFREFKTATIDDRVMCAGFARGGKDACQGDSGGPLMYPKGKTMYAIGVVSYGFRCAEPGFYGVYSKTTAFLDFILPLLN